MANWQKPPSDKGRAATQERDLKPGKSDLKTPPDSDWHYAAKQAGMGYSGNATQVNRYRENPSVQEYRNPPEHKFQTQPYGGDSGMERVAMQNSLARKRK